MASENLGTLTADLVANTGGFEKGMDRAQRALKATAKEAAYQGTQLEKLVGQIDPVTGALSKLDKQQQQLDAHFKAGRLPLDDYRQFSKILDQQKTSAANSVVGFQKLDKQMASNGQTLKQYQNNLRGVPAQFTDIFTSLQGGQAPLTVLLQQGGQLKDMFGGVGAAGKALGGYVLGLVNPFTVAAAAAVALGVAYAKGSAESTAYNTALAATGNFAGTSSDSLASMAAQIAQTTGTVGAAAEVLAQLAGSGKIAVGSFDEIAVAALKTQVATGQAASEIVANFVKIAEDPLKAVIKLNEGMNFLSESIYSQIKAFQDQGDAASAAALANTAYADALNGISDKVNENLGYIESAWKIVKGAAKDAWDAMLNVGRDTTLDAAIDEAQKLVNTLAEAKKLNNTPGNGFAPDNSIREQDAQQRLTDLLVQRDEKNRRESSARVSAQQKADALSAAQEIDKIHASFASKDEQRDKARAEYLQLIDKLQAGVKKGSVQGDDPRLNAERIAKDLDAIDEKYKEKKAARAKAYVEDAGTKELDQAKQQYAILEQQSQQLDEQTGKLKAIGPAQQELIKWEQELADIKTKQTLTAAQKSLLATADQITAQKTLNANLEQETEARKVNAEQAKQLAEFTQAQADALSRFQQGLDNQVAGIGLGSEGRQRLKDDLALQNDYANQVERLRRDKLSGKITQETYDQETGILKENLGKQLAAYQDNYAKIDAARGQWQNGMSAALQDYLYDVQDVAGQTYTLFSNSFKGLEDSLVDFISTGKLSFKSLADSILADIARIIIRTQVLGPLLSSLGVGGSTTGSGVSGAISSVLGAGNGGGLGGILGTVKNVVSVAGSSFGKAIISGFNSGDGIVGGLQNAFSNGAEYIGSSITSAFASGSATASNAAASLAAGSTQAGYTGAAYGSYVTSANAASSLSALSATLSYVGAVYSVIESYKAYGAKGAATTAGFAAAGAAIGSVVPVIGTALGAAIGAVVGSFASSKAFGTGEKYPDLSTSATGRYINGQYTDTGAATTWQRNAPKYGAAADAAMSSTLNKFSMTLGNLYEVLGNGADVVAYSTLQQRKTSGKYSSTFGAQLDDGSVITAKQQFKASDISAALTADYDDIMGTFLAKAIVSSKSLPDYFKAQFTEFANSWDTTADEVIKAIEGVFTRFNGVNDALSLINVNNLKLDDTGLQASDAILNMIGSMSDLDLATASAKDKVDALNTSVTAYYKAFFTADEQLADLKKSLEGAFGTFGLQLPDTRAAYRAMVEDIDVTTAAGQAMFATLVGLATNADSYYSNLEQTAKAAADAAAQAAKDAADAAEAAAKEAADAAQAAADAAAQAIAEVNAALMKAANDSFSKLQRSIDAQQKALEDAYNARVSSLNDMLDTANAKVSDLKGVSDDLGSALKSLRGDSDEAVKMLRAQAQATLQSALSIARAGGSLSGVAGLSDALDTVGTNNTSLYASLEDFNRDQGRTAAVVAELNDINGKQLTNAEKTVVNLEAQLDQAKKTYDIQTAALNAQLEIGQALIDSLNGVDTTVSDVATAVRMMNASVVAALAALPGSGPGSAGTNTWENNAAIVHSAYKTAFGRDADEGGLKFWTDALQSGSLSYDQLLAALVKVGRENSESIKLPGYATGGRASGYFWAGENGPEIVATGGAQVYSAAQSKAIMSSTSGDTNADREWREQVNAALYAIAKNTMKTAKNTDLIPQKLQEELDL